MKRDTNHQHNHHLGFTLIEVVTVIMVLSVTSVLGTYIMVNLYETKTTLTLQTQTLNKSQIALDRIHKQVSKALPYSLRVSNGRACLTFMPVLAQGFYLTPLPDRINGNPPSGATIPIDVAYYSIDFGMPQFIAVGVDNSNQIYGSSPSSLATIDSISPTNIRLSNNYQWRNNDPNQRFLMTDLAQAYCFIDDELRYYSDLSPQENSVNLSGRFTVLLDNVALRGNPFELDLSGCNHCVEIRFSSPVAFADRTIDHLLTVALTYAHY